MKYYEVLVADSKYHGGKPLTYSYDQKLAKNSIVTVQLRQRLVTGFIDKEVKKPGFETKPIKAVLSSQPLPDHLLKLAIWLAEYYVSNVGDVFRQLHHRY